MREERETPNQIYMREERETNNYMSAAPFWDNHLKTTAKITPKIKEIYEKRISSHSKQLIINPNNYNKYK